MLRRIARGWAFVKVSWSVLSRHPKLLILPIFSTAALLLIFGFIAASVFWTGLAHEIPSIFQQLHTPIGQIVGYGILFVFYLINMFIMIFFNAALVFCTLEAFAGKTPSLTAGLAATWRRLPQILAWTFVASTVGVILNILENMLERTLGFLGSLLGGTVEIGWTVATYFVVPVIVIEGVGPIEAVKRSSAALKRSWGDSATGEGGFTVISFFFILPAFLLLLWTPVRGIWIGHFALGHIVFALYALATSLIFAALSIIFRTGVFVYATTGTVPQGFDSGVLDSAFSRKKG